MDLYERLFLSILMKYNAVDLKYLLDRNVDLATTVQVYAFHLVQIAKICVKVFHPKMEELTSKNMLEYLRERRHDLYTEITKHKNRTWLDRNLEGFRKFILS